MTIDLYVVTTNIYEHADREALEQLKVQLCAAFGGLTVINNCDGYWMDNGQLIHDDVQIWRIESSTVISANAILPYAERLKAICKQKSQLITSNGRAYFV